MEVETQVKNKDGKQNTQLELGRVKLRVRELITRLIKSIEVNMLHLTESRWRTLMMRIDITMSDPNKHRIICTDFGATLDLGAAEKGNCSVDNHSVMCTLFVVSNWREVEYVNTKGNADKTIINDCDKWIFFGDTMSKGKKNDHVFHNTCLDYIVNFYDGERERAALQKIPINILHTDNSAGE